MACLCVLGSAAAYSQTHNDRNSLLTVLRHGRMTTADPDHWPRPTDINSSGGTRASETPFGWSIPVAQSEVAASESLEPVATTAEPAGSESASQSGADADRRFGEEPANIRQIFLRESSSLIGAGRMQRDIGVTYSLQQRNDLAVFSDGSLGLQRVRDRQILVPVTWRYGIVDDLEAFAVLPVGLSVVERSDLLDRTSELRAGLGDVGGGFLYQLHRETADSPDVILGGSFTAPTGATPFGTSSDIASLGRGFWTVATELSFVKSYDPVVVYGSVGYRHEFENEFSGVRITPGEVFTYSFGVGFAANDDIALTAEMVGEFQSEYQFNGDSIPNTSLEPVSLRIGLTRRVSRNFSVQPFLSAGLTDDAPQIFVGVFWIKTQDRPGAHSGFPWRNRNQCRADCLP